MSLPSPSGSHRGCRSCQTETQAEFSFANAVEMSLFKKKPKTISLRLIEFCRDGYCAVVGESHYQDALLATSTICEAGPEGRPTFTAVLIAEPQNPYDPNAIAIYSPHGTLGYLSREDAVV